MKSTTIILAVAAIIVLGGVFYFATNKNAPVSVVPAQGSTTATSSNTTGTTVGVTAGVSVTAGSPVVVTYGPSGFTPATVTIKVGQSVTFINKTSQGMWVASNPHPAHSGYSGTSRSQHCPDTAGTAFDECAVNSTYTFVFAKAGTWGYHNHLVDENGGTVIVQN